MSFVRSMPRCLCRACAWQGRVDQVVPFSNLVAWLSHQDRTDIVILPEGECPQCGTPVYNPAAEERLARAIALLGPNIPAF